MIHSIEDSLWRQVDQIGDEIEFLHFSSLTRESFNLLVELCSAKINNMPLDSRYKTSKRHKITSRRHTPRDIVAVGLKYRISTGEHEDLFT